MLPKSYQLPSPLIKSVMQSGRRATTPELTGIWSENTTTQTRFAFIVSTKVDKRATTRNRIKRVLSESVRQLAPNMKFHADVVLIAKSRKLGESTERTVGMLSEILRRI